MWTIYHLTYKKCLHKMHTHDYIYAAHIHTPITVHCSAHGCAHVDYKETSQNRSLWTFDEDLNFLTLPHEYKLIEII